MRKNHFFVFLLLFLIPITNCYTKNNTVNKIIINGNKKYNSDYYLGFVSIKEGDKFNNDTQNEIIKELFSTGYLDNIKSIKFDKKTGIVLVEVEEKPFIKDIIFKNAKELKEDIIKDNIKSTKKEVFSDKILMEDVEFIKSFYISQGFLRVSVSTELKNYDDKSVEITFNVEKGNKAKIRNIVFIGNKVFSDRILKEEIFSKENRFYRFGRAIYYDHNMLDYDAYLLSQFYMSKGYYDFNLIAANGIYNKEDNNFDIVYTIEENNKYEISEIKIDDKVKKIDEKILDDVISDIKKGDIFNVKLIQNKIDKLNSIFVESGNTFVSINPKLIKEENNTIKIILEIDNTEKKYIGRIRIKNNSRTIDSVIREQLNIEEGSSYNEFSIRRSIQKIEGLGFFEKVTYTEENGIFDNQTDINIIVEEGSTGSFNFSIGYSSLDGLNIGLNFSQRNLFGRAIQFGMDIGIFENAKRFSLDFAKPKIFGTNIMGGLGFSVQDNNNTKNSRFNLGFDDFSIGGNVFIRYDITDFLSQRIEYSYEYKKLDNITKPELNILPKGKRKTSEISTNISYDRRNNYYSPTKGYFLDLDISYAGIGGNVDYIKTVGHAMLYYPIYLDKVIFKLEGKAGYITSLNNNSLYPNDGFYLGGYNMRGFEFAGVGPRVKLDKEYYNGLSGTKMAYVNLETKFPVFLPKDFSLYGILFINAGVTTGVEKNNNINTLGLVEIEDSKSIRAAYGISILWQIKMLGNLSFDFSKTLRKEVYDRDESFRFNVGTRF